jgi:hypothetical protein
MRKGISMGVVSYIQYVHTGYSKINIHGATKKRQQAQATSFPSSSSSTRAPAEHKLIILFHNHDEKGVRNQQPGRGRGDAMPLQLRYHPGYCTILSGR